jgi:hypothetical protein
MSYIIYVYSYSTVEEAHFFEMLFIASLTFKVTSHEKVCGITLLR